MVLRIHAARGARTVAVFIFVTLLSALLVPAAAQNATPVSAIWLADHKNLKRIDLGTNQIDQTVTLAHDAKALAVDPADGGVWALTEKQLSKFDNNGQSILRVDLKSQVKELDDPKQLTLDPYDSSLWVAGEKILLHVNAQGQRLGAWKASDEIQALGLDIDESLWLLTHRQLLHESPQGTVLQTQDLKSLLKDPELLAVDNLGGLLWVAGHRNLIQLELNHLDQAPRTIPIPGSAPGAREDDDKKILALTVDPLMGNLWVVTKDNLLLFYDRGGNLLKNIDISSRDLGAVEQIAFEPMSASFWLGGKKAVGRFSSNGDFVARIGGDNEIRALGVAPFRLAPTLSLLEPTEDDLTNNPRPPIRLGLGASCNAMPCFLPDGYTRSLVLNVSLNGQAIGSLFSRSTSNEALYIAPSRLPEGLNILNAQAVDLFGHASDPLTGHFTIDTIPPKFLSITPTNGSTLTQANVVIRGQVDDPTAVVLLEGLSSFGGQIFNTDPRNFAFQLTLHPGENSLTLTATDAAHNVATTVIKLMLGGTLPPDPSTVAPQIDLTVASTIAADTAFLYTGTNPIQRDVAPNAIDPKRAAVLRGLVQTRDNAALAGVTVRIKDHPEYGQTISRADGMFDLVVNGGGLLTVEYLKEGFLPVQRQANPPWQDYARVPDAMMVSLDAKVTVIDLTSAAPMQVARGSVITDQDGTRQPTILFPQGTTATLVMPDGTSRALTAMHVRATEYTVGPNGPKAMPAPLPPTSAYTYAVELNADEAVAAGAKQLQFSQPIPVYVNNFLNFPVGEKVPVGYYDPNKAAWIPSANGRVIKILSISGGMASLDVDGSGNAASPSQLATLGITDAERTQLASLYQPGQSLWRFAVPHFSSWDANWGIWPPNDAQAPTQPNPQDNPNNKPVDQPDCKTGSVIECQNQILGEKLDIVGTPFSLHYSSDRVPGRRTAYSLKIPLSGATVPASLLRIDLEVDVAGQTFTQSFSPAANLSYTFTWDGLDAYGRMLQGSQPAHISIGYVYPATYQRVDRFGYNGNGSPITGNPTRTELTLWQYQIASIGAWDASAEGLGAWTVNVHHGYNPIGRALYLGDGSRRSAESRNSMITTVAGTSTGFSGDGGPATAAQFGYPIDVAVDAQNNLYIADMLNHRIRKVDSNGIITTVAGNGVPGFSGDGGPATAAQLNSPYGITIDAQGNLYIGDAGNHRIRKVDSNGIITTVAGNGVPGFSGDGGPATAAQLKNPNGLAIDAQGILYIADDGNVRIRRVDPSGIITTVAGNGGLGFSGDGGPATAAQFFVPVALAVDSQGDLYITDLYNHRVRKVVPSGIITTIAGNNYGFSGDGGLATAAQLTDPSGLAVDAQGSLYISDRYNSRIRKIDANGIITTVVGNGAFGFSGDGGAATASRITNTYGLAVDPQGNLLMTDLLNFRIRKVSRPLPGFTATDLAIPSEDGAELYQFDSTGRHLRTLNARTGAVLYRFTYDSSGYLVQIEDGDGNKTVIERDTAGNPVAIVSPDGLRATLTLDGNGYLATATNPAGETTKMTYSADGLMSSFTNARGYSSVMTYDAVTGRLTKDQNAAGGFWALSRTEQPDSYSANLTSASGRTTGYYVQNLSTGDQQRVNTAPDGTQTSSLIKTDGTTVTTAADGTVTTLVKAGDPRFGMQSPITKSLTARMPSGLTSTLSASRSVALADPNNAMSLTIMTDTVTVNGKTTTTAYYAATMQYATTMPSGRRQSFTFIDSQGRPTQTLVSGLDPVAYAYDPRGRLATIAQGSGANTRQTTLTYTPQGFLGSITDALGRNQSYSYDPAGRVTQQTLPDARVIQYAYDANGNVTSITPPSKPSHAFTYTSVNLESQYTPPTAGITTPATQYAYNLDKQLTKITRPDGQTVDFGYDTGGRLSTITLPNGTVTYAYSATTGNLQTLTAPDNGTVSYAYDGALLTGETWAGPVNGTVTRTYDSELRVTTLAVNGNGIAFGYDADSLLTQAGSLALGRDPQHGLITGTTLGSVTTAQAYNPFGETTQFTASQSGSPVLDVQYTRDKLGRITQKIEVVGGQTDTYVYTYDLGGRLTDVTKNGSTIAHYSYDANSNRTGKSGVSGNVIASYDDQDRLLSYGSTSYAYTDNGELKSKTFNGQTTSYVYDVLGNLRSVSLPNGVTIDYVIDGRNRRIGKKVNGTLTQAWLYQNQLSPVAELDGSGNITTRFVYGSKPNVPDYLIKGGTTYRIVSDHLGSPRLIVNTSDGTVAQRIDYDEFGNVLTDTNPGFQPFGFAGGIYDRDTKLVRFGARDYDPETGRWTAKDPIRFRGGDANLYGYTMNDPVNFIDPDGLYSWSEFRQDVVDFTGGCSNNSFIDDALNNFVNTNEEIGYYRLGLGAAFGGAFASQYGGLTAVQAVLRGIGYRSVGGAITTVAGTSAINAVLIGGAFQVGNLTGSLLRTGINRAFSSSSCGCSAK